MAELTLVSPSPRPLQPLVEGALAERTAPAGGRGPACSDLRLQEFEARYGWSTTDFVQRYENDALEETLNFAGVDRRIPLGESVYWRKRTHCEKAIQLAN